MLRKRILLLGSTVFTSAVGVSAYIHYRKRHNVVTSQQAYFPILKPAFAHGHHHDSEMVKPPSDPMSSSINHHHEKKASALNGRFETFATVEYNNEFYMTPRDFLNSLTMMKPNYLPYKRRLEAGDVECILDNTPRKWRNTSHFFRHLDKKGLICYSEYIFLLALLTQPLSGFRIAFNLFDTDGSQEIDLMEFLVLNRVISDLNTSQSMKLSKEEQLKTMMMEEKTTLLCHFFGPKGNDRLSYQDFSRFMENFQTEVLDVEFQAHALGYPAISEVDFARVLLKYTKIKKKKHDALLRKIQQAFPVARGIKFDEFKKFFQFLNSLDDFATAMRFFALADQSITKEDFQRAVHACVNYRLSDAVVDTLFAVFPSDNGQVGLDHKLFVRSMKDRLSRGIIEIQAQEVSRLQFFRQCVKENMRHHID